MIKLQSQSTVTSSGTALQ